MAWSDPHYSSQEGLPPPQSVFMEYATAFVVVVTEVTQLEAANRRYKSPPAPEFSGAVQHGKKNPSGTAGRSRTCHRTFRAPPAN